MNSQYSINQQHVPLYPEASNPMQQNYYPTPSQPIPSFTQYPPPFQIDASQNFVTIPQKHYIALLSNQKEPISAIIINQPCQYQTTPIYPPISCSNCFSQLQQLQPNPVIAPNYPPPNPLQPQPVPPPNISHQQNANMVSEPMELNTPFHPIIQPANGAPPLPSQPSLPVVDENVSVVPIENPADQNNVGRNQRKFRYRQRYPRQGGDNHHNQHGYDNRGSSSNQQLPLPPPPLYPPDENVLYSSNLQQPPNHIQYGRNANGPYMAQQERGVTYFTPLVESSVQNPQHETAGPVVESPIQNTLENTNKNRNENADEQCDVEATPEESIPSTSTQGVTQPKNSKPKSSTTINTEHETIDEKSMIDKEGEHQDSRETPILGKEKKPMNYAEACSLKNTKEKTLSVSKISSSRPVKMKEMPNIDNNQITEKKIEKPSPIESQSSQVCKTEKVENENKKKLQKLDEWHTVTKGNKVDSFNFETLTSKQKYLHSILVQNENSNIVQNTEQLNETDSNSLNGEAEVEITETVKDHEKQKKKKAKTKANKKNKKRNNEENLEMENFEQLIEDAKELNEKKIDETKQEEDIKSAIIDEIIQNMNFLTLEKTYTVLTEQKLIELETKFAVYTKSRRENSQKLELKHVDPLTEVIEFMESATEHLKHIIDLIVFLIPKAKNDGFEELEHNAFEAYECESELPCNLKNREAYKPLVDAHAEEFKMEPHVRFRLASEYTDKRLKYYRSVKNDLSKSMLRKLSSVKRKITFVENAYSLTAQLVNVTIINRESEANLFVTIHSRAQKIIG